MTITTWMRTVVAALSVTALAQAQAPLPKGTIPQELAGWQSWVQYDQEFRRCPFFANTDGTDESNRVCAWPGRLSLEVNQTGGRFTQTWVSYSDAWVTLPGSVEYWPGAVTVNGAAAAVVARDGLPQVRVAAGSATVAGNFIWAKRPESLAIPPQTGLITLNLDGRRLAQVDRPEGAVWLGRRHEADVAQQLDVQVYRLLSDGIPPTLTTRVNLQVAGDAREETLPRVLPPGFAPMSLDSELPARIDADGRLRVQVRTGNWTITIAARTGDGLATITIPAAQGKWPRQEIWSYQPDDRLRVAGLEGAAGIDPAQANVPPEWRRYPSFRIIAGGAVKIVERSRGVSPQEGNHLDLRRELYLDFAHQGFTAIDQISGQMRSGWRLDMRPPYRLMRAASGRDDLLVTEAGDAALSGVELRRPAVDLSAVARIAVPGGTLPASGWTERFDHVAGVLNLPPGHRLLAAFGADSAPDAWLERWGLLDLFLSLIATVISWRLFGWRYAGVTLLALVLVHQEDPSLVWLILGVLLSLAARAASAGRLRAALGWAGSLLLGLLLVVSVPFAVTQLRFAAYPQLVDRGGDARGGDAHGGDARGGDAVARDALAAAPINAPAAPPAAVRNFARPAEYAAAPSAAPALEEVVISGARKSSASLGSVRSGLSTAPPPEPPQRYAPGTSVQAGPGVPRWHYAAYPFSWSGPVDAAQTVHFIILRPWAVGLWRVLGVVLLAVLCLRLSRDCLGLRAWWQPLRGPRGTAAALLLAVVACTALCPTVHASSTPDRELLDELKTRLSRPPECVPNCAEIMAARVVLTPANLETSLDVAALSSVAVALPSAGPRADPDAISIDGVPVSGVYLDGDRQMWIPLKAGVHTVKLNLPLPPADSIQLLFPQVPRAIAVSGAGWDVSGVNAGRLLGNTIELLRRRAAGHEADAPQGAAQFPPFVRIRREFSLDLDWSLQTTVQRIAPDKGGFTLEIPLLAGESVLTTGIETNDGTRVLAGFDSNAGEFGWRSGLPQSDTLVLTAARDRPWREVWTFRVSPMWHVQFSGLPAVMPGDLRSQDWTFEYFPRAGESLTLAISRPAAAPGGTLAIDDVGLELEAGKRSSNAMLVLGYRSTQGGRHSVSLPEAARVSAVLVDGVPVSIRPEKGQLSLGLLPGAHRVQIQWQSGEGAALRTRMPQVDLQLPSSNISSTLRLPQDRWVLYAAGGGVGPAILYWGELCVFVVLAIALGRSRRTSLRSREWLLLGLGLSTFSWSALLLFAVWMFAMRWRQGLRTESLGRRQFNLLQLALLAWSLLALGSLVIAIPFGLLGNPDMRIAGIGQGAGELRWFDDQAPGALPTAWVLSVSVWWYKAAMLLWALWLAFALVRWLAIARQALTSGGFWRKAPPAVTPAAASAPPAGGA